MKTKSNIDNQVDMLLNHGVYKVDIERLDICQLLMSCGLPDNGEDIIEHILRGTEGVFTVKHLHCCINGRDWKYNDSYVETCIERMDQILQKLPPRLELTF